MLHANFKPVASQRQNVPCEGMVMAFKGHPRYLSQRLRQVSHVVMVSQRSGMQDTCATEDSIVNLAGLGFFFRPRVMLFLVN